MIEMSGTALAAGASNCLSKTPAASAVPLTSSRIDIRRFVGNYSREFLMDLFQSSRRFVLAFSLFVIAATSIHAQDALLETGELRLTTVATNDNVESLALTQGDAILLQSPSEGLWSIATDWADDWPTAWTHAAPTSIERNGPWLVVKGSIETPEGVWELQDSYRPVEGAEAFRCVRRWKWTGEQAAEKTTLSVRWQAPNPDAQLVIPGNCYFGNPSGVETGFGVVPQFGGVEGEELFLEEHRCPMPFACVEWDTTGSEESTSELYAATLHSLPSPAPMGNVPDQWWSIGAIGQTDSTELALLSGPIAMNGQRSVAKTGQRTTSPYPDTWISVPPGGVIEKTFYIEAYPVARTGSGFQRSIRTSLALFEPTSVEGLPTMDQILADKYRFAQSRWYEDDESAGFRMFPHNNQYVMGWAGQSEAPGFALLALRGRFGDDAVRMAVLSLDHLAKSPFNDDGFLIRYDPDTNEWMRQDPISQGQAMQHFALAIEVGRPMEDVNTRLWEVFLQRACDIHADRILADDWRPVSTNEGFLVPPLCKAYQLFGSPKYRDAALKAAEHYAERHFNMSEPYWGGTLDARCEDKEGAWAAFQAFLAVYETFDADATINDNAGAKARTTMNRGVGIKKTGDPQHLEWAEHAMDVTLTYTYVWDVPMPPGRLADHGLKTRGWTSVSVQNQHLDVYGVLYTPEIYRMGELLNRDDLKQLAHVMFQTCGQMLDADGSQGEQLNHTNFVQFRGLTDDVYKMRGTYAEDWTVFWMTAHFLTAAAKYN
jgi:hypothetical protein